MPAYRISNHGIITIMNTQTLKKIVYFSHGGGPLPILGDPSHQAMIDFMRELPSQLIEPEAILVISAHWEEATPTLLGAPNPAMFYDYYGFPPQAYQINYPAPGDPTLAKNIAAKLAKAGIPSRVDDQRGFDHGLFIPLALMYPVADIPALQLSLIKGLSPIMHLALGRALRDLLEEPILVIGSGFSFHNMAAYFHHDPAFVEPRNDPFQDWLIQTVTGEMTGSAREKRLNEWESAPHARYCHPREEHLLPLHACAALANCPGATLFDDQILGVRSLAFGW
jgi:aromatic ring-opening dioxygenase catalytic subunit (LigB family)